jgi:hypothetical protein
MHRLIMLSRTYQLGGDAGSHNGQKDPGNQLHSRYSRRRLDAEAIRDTMLLLGGNMDRSRSGPHPFPPVETWGFTQHNPFNAVYPSNRRSVYLMTQRLKRHPFLALFDGPDPNASTARRIETTVPTQTLFFLNDPFVHEQAAGLARRLLHDRSDEASRLRLAHELAFARLPTEEELRKAQLFLEHYQQLLRAAGTAAGQHELQSWTAFARTLLARNEFLYLD